MSCVVVCISLDVVRCFEGLPARPYISWGGQGYMEIPTRVLVESYSNEVEEFPCTSASPTAVREVAKR